jgi:hypothetical protein
MRKLWFRRKGVSTMIGGIILLIIFLAGLVFMAIVGQQYDVFQSTAAEMQQRQIDMYSENLLAAYPGVSNGLGNPVPPPPATPLSFQVSCGTTQCNNYTLTLNNLGINAQIVRIYINSATVCSSCILDPSATTTPTPYRFRVSDRMVNSGESSHFVVFWLPSNVLLSSCTISSPCKVSVVTARGRVFSFLYPFPTVTAVSGAQGGGTGIYIGPLVITFQKALLTYTTGYQSLPIVPTGGGRGYWVIPSVSANEGIILYVKIQTDVGVKHDVYLTPQTVFELMQFIGPGAVNYFFLVAPISSGFCNKFYNATYNNDIDCSLATYNNGLAAQHTAHTAPYSGDPSSDVVAYAACGAPPSTYNTTCQARYIIPKPNPTQFKNHKRGSPVIVAFAVSGPSLGSNKLQTTANFQSGAVVTSFLGLSYVYDNGTGLYLYGVTLPFIALCLGGTDKSGPPTTCPI